MVFEHFERLGILQEVIETRALGGKKGKKQNEAEKRDFTENVGRIRKPYFTYILSFV